MISRFELPEEKTMSYVAENNNFIHFTAHDHKIIKNYSFAIQ